MRALSSSGCGMGGKVAGEVGVLIPTLQPVTKAILPDGNELELPGRRERPRRRARDRPAPGRCDGRGRGRRRAARPAPAAARRRAPAHPARGRRRGAAGPAPLDRAPHGRGRAAPLAGHEGRDRARDRGRLLLRLRLRRDARRGRSRAHRGRDARDPQARPARLRAHRDARARTPSRASPREGETYKVEIAEALPAGEQVTFYEQDGFVDLCRGPHLQTTKPIKRLQAHVARGRLLARRLGRARC